VYVQSEGAWQRRDIQIGIHNNLEAAGKAGAKPGDVLALDRPSSSESPQVSP